MTQILASVDDNNRGACLNNVWNSDTLAWEKMEQPLIDNATSNIYLAVDGLETLVTATNTKLDTLDGRVDGLEGLATDIKANQTNSTQKVKITDGTDIANVTTDGALQVEDRFLAIAGGEVTGHSTILKFGRNPDIDSGVEETIWEGGGLYPFPTAAQSLEVVSSSANDTSAGTGARTITLIGLDGVTMAEQTQVITLNGITAVAIPSTWYRVHRCSVTTAGTGNVNEGLITVRVAGGGTTLLVIGIGNGQTLMAVYTIPAGYTGYMTSYYVSGNATPTLPVLDIKLFTRPDGGVINLKHQQAMGGSTILKHNFNIPFKILEKTDIYLNAISSVINTDVCGGFDIILVSN